MLVALEVTWKMSKRGKSKVPEREPLIRSPPSVTPCHICTEWFEMQGSAR